MTKRVWEWVDEFGVGAEPVRGKNTEGVSTGNGTMGSVTGKCVAGSANSSGVESVEWQASSNIVLRYSFSDF